MEILIPGLLLVGFMIWASTRIKRNAAKAFEREEIETAEFSLVKPEGFLAMAEPAEGTVFSAYSKDFGVDEAERVRKASVEIRRFDNAHFDEVRERAREESSGTVEEQIGVINGAKCANIVAARSADGVPVETYLKIIAAPNAVYQLSLSALPQHKEELSRGIDELLTSFVLK